MNQVQASELGEKLQELHRDGTVEDFSGSARMIVLCGASRHVEVERLAGLGATVVDPPHDDAGFLTTILAGPQGNEFCVIRPPDGSYAHQRLAATS